MLCVAAPNDYGEGQTYIGTANVATDSGGDASFGPLSFPYRPVDRSSPPPPPTPTATPPSSPGPERDHKLPAHGAGGQLRDGRHATDGGCSRRARQRLRSNNDLLTAVKVSDPAHGTLTLNANGSSLHAKRRLFRHGHLHLQSERRRRRQQHRYGDDHGEPGQ